MSAEISARGARPSNRSLVADWCALRLEADYLHLTLGFGRQPGDGRHPPEALNAVVTSHILIRPPGRVLSDLSGEIYPRAVHAIGSREVAHRDFDSGGTPAHRL